MQQPSCIRGQELIESISDWLWEVDERCVYTYSSPQVMNLLGYQPGEIIGHTPFEFMPADEEKRVLAAFWRLAEARQPLAQLESVSRHKDGRLVVLETSGRPIIDLQGRFRGYRGTARDITERKHVEQALRESEQRYRVLIERVNVIAWEADPRTWQFTFVSSHAETITGHPSDRWLAHDFWQDHLHPDDRAEAIRLCMTATAAGEPHEFEYRLIKADGGVVWIRDLAAVDMHEGQPVRLYGVMIDISDRKRAEQALQVSHAQYQSVVSALAEGIVIVNAQGIIVACNQSAERILGMTQREIVGSLCDDSRWECLHSDGSPFSSREFPVAVTRRTGQARHEVIMGLTRPGGTIVWISVNTQPMPSPAEGESTGVVVSFHDITDRRRDEERQRLLMQELDHRVKNNLAAVLSISEQTLAASSSLAEFRHAFTSRIAAMARAHEALARARWEAVDLNAIARMVLGSYLDDPSQPIAIRGQSAHVPPATAIPLGLTLHELLTNALKHGALSVAGGRVTLEWECDTTTLDLRWCESGGPPIANEPAPGVGMRLIDGLIGFELRGTVRSNYRPQGACWEMRIPLAASSGNDNRARSNDQARCIQPCDSTLS